MSEDNDFPVDIVYLWCDGGDSEFLRRKADFSDGIVCINNFGAKESGNKMERMYLEHRFPKKSCFEK